MPALKLTSEQAYAATVRFLQKMHQEFGWQELAPLLGSMSLIDGVPLDIALFHDWLDVLQAATDLQPEAAQACLTREQAYAVMLGFLQQVFSMARPESLELLLEDMPLVNGISANPSLMVYWNDAFRFVANGGGQPPFSVTRDGVVYELHREPSGKD